MVSFMWERNNSEITNKVFILQCSTLGMQRCLIFLISQLLINSLFTAFNILFSSIDVKPYSQYQK